jgi:tetratricopeptide (TPR) repeat protein
MRRQTSQIIANITLEILTSTLGVSAKNGFPTISGNDFQLLVRSRDLGLLLNLLKISSESSYEFLQTLQAEIYSEDSPLLPEWKSIAHQLNLNLDLLTQLVFPSLLPSAHRVPQVNKQQEHLILDMKASLLGNLGGTSSLPSPLCLSLLFFLSFPALGDLYLAINQETESIRLFRESLSIYQRLKVLKDQAGLGGGGGDKRALLSIQASLARALCSGPDSDEGMELFRVTIAEEAAHVGPFHHNLLTKYYNAGICAAAKGLIVEAIEDLNRCLKTCESNPHVPKDSTCSKAQGYLHDLHKRRRFAPAGDL